MIIERIACFLLIAAFPPDQAIDIGIKVWQNECHGSTEGLTSWNDGEDFASLGIGHFIWYPVNRKGPYVETFPELLHFLKSRDVDMPRWLEEARGCPWRSRDQFLAAVRSGAKKIAELRHLLQKTVSLQAEFLRNRLEKAVPSILLQTTDEKKKAALQAKYDRIAAHPMGYYALIDYLNFKGDGTSENERYQGQGWGLYQVLEQMPDDLNADPIDLFAQSAKSLLKQRVLNAPCIKNEQRFLNGWILRINSYLPPKKHNSPKRS
jgi:hypothetical protein